MKTTGEKIESLTEINAGDYYISTSRTSGKVFLCKVHRVDAGSKGFVESCFLIVDLALRGNTFGNNYWHFFDNSDWDYRWATEEELTKYGIKIRKVMFHEC